MIPEHYHLFSQLIEVRAMATERIVIAGAEAVDLNADEGVGMAEHDSIGVNIPRGLEGWCVAGNRTGTWCSRECWCVAGVNGDESVGVSLV